MKLKRANPVAFAFVSAATLAVVVLVRPAWAQTHQPADKIQVSASTIEVMDTTQPQPVTLLTATLRTSTPADLLIQVTGECALFTEVMSPDGHAKANVKFWVELDRMPVPVTSDPAKGGPDDGKVIFCNREFQVTSADLIVEAGGGTAEAAVGKRTLIVEPAH